VNKQKKFLKLCPKGHNQVIKFGYFFRETGHLGRVQRYFCKDCASSFSDQTGALTYRERKPHLTQKVLRLAMESVSQRGCARLLGCRPITVARKIIRIGNRAELHLKDRQAKNIAAGQETTVIFDDMETFEHTKCKPISVSLAVAASSRQVIAISAAEMPAKSTLAKRAVKRYGPRADNRPESLRRVLNEVKRLCPNLTLLKSDCWPKYPVIVKEVFGKHMPHEQHKGRRGCVVGQGELKRGGRDPLFALNHTCAMFRDRIKRLSRRTWCTTKKIERLRHLLNIYAWWHNRMLAPIRGPIRMD